MSYRRKSNLDQRIEEAFRETFFADNGLDANDLDRFYDKDEKITYVKLLKIDLVRQKLAEKIDTYDGSPINFEQIGG